jgi:REP element-mobilizing transposase RayT
VSIAATANREPPSKRKGKLDGQHRELNEGGKCDSLGQGVWGSQVALFRTKLWGRGYFVTTVGRDEAVIRNYIPNQKKEDERFEQLRRWR